MGALVSVAVTGGGLVVDGEPAGCTRAAVTTAGVAGEACRDHNLPVLAGHQHAVPIALFAGSSRSLDAIDLGAAPDTCLMFTAPNAGEIVVGVNDTERGNDSGAFVFHFDVGPPIAAIRPAADRPALCP